MYPPTRLRQLTSPEAHTTHFVQARHRAMSRWPRKRSSQVEGSFESGTNELGTQMCCQLFASLVLFNEDGSIGPVDGACLNEILT